MKRRRTLLALLCAGMALNQTAPAALQVTTAIYASESEQPFAEEENVVLNKPQVLQPLSPGAELNVR